MYTGSAGVNGLGDSRGPAAAAAAAPAGKPLRRIRCTTAELEQVNRVLGQSLTADQVQGLLQKSVDGAAELARGAAPPVVGQRAKLFGAVFGVPPSWHPSGVDWMLGGVVRKRFRLAGELLSGGSLWFACFGLPWPGTGSGPDRPEGYVLRAAGNVYRVGLGRLFWESMRDGDAASAEAALLGAALRVYFGKLIAFQAAAPAKNRVHCYMRYALHAAGRTVPGWIGAGCAIPPARWNRLMPAPPPAPAATPPAPGPAPARPIRLRLTDQELERILGRPLADPLSEHINWIITQVPPTAAAKPTLGDQLRRKLDEKVDQVSDRLGVPQRLRKYVRKVAGGAAEKGAKLIVEEGLRLLGMDNAEAIEAIWATVERATQESP